MYPVHGRRLFPAGHEARTVIFCLPGRRSAGERDGEQARLANHCFDAGVVPIFCLGESDRPCEALNLSLAGCPTRGEDQLPFEGNVPYDFLCFIGRDAGFIPPQLDRLMGLGLDMVSGLYPTESGRRYTAVRDGLLLGPVEVNHLQEPLEVDFAGLGFTLVRKGVVESLSYPWFRPVAPRVEGLTAIPPEEVDFCLRVREKGFKIHIDPVVRLARVVGRTYL